MSAIGDYIHFTSKGYYTYGASKNTVNFNYDNQQALIQNRLNNFATKNVDLTELEDAINAIKDPVADGDIAEIQNVVVQHLRQSFNYNINSIDLNTMTVDVDNPSLQLSPAQRHLNENSQLVFNIKEITSKINQIEEAISKDPILKGATVSGSNITLKEKVEQLKQLYHEIYGKTAKQIASWGYKYKGIPSRPSSSKINQLRKQVNAIIEEFFAFLPIPVMEGKLWENVIKIAGYVATGAGVEAMKESLQVKNTGDTNIKVKISNNFIKTPKVQDTINNLLKINAKGEISRRSKVDVSLTWNNGEAVNISAKNVTLKEKYGWISVVDNSPLLVMIAGINTNFINHYLNYYTLHDRQQKPIKDDNLIYQDMKRILFYEAVSGDNFSNSIDIANVFALNDKVSGKIKLYYMGDLVKKITDARDISVKMNNQNIANYYFHNDWQKTLDQRIANLIIQLHQAKVSVAFNIGGSSSVFG